MKHDEKGDKVDVDMTLDKAKAADFDAMLLPGGVLHADALRVGKRSSGVRQANGRGGQTDCRHLSPTGVAGIGGRGKRAYPNGAITPFQDDIRNAGGQWVDDEVVHDQNWVSSRQPSDIPAFNREMISLFAERGMKAKEAA